MWITSNEKTQKTHWFCEVEEAAKGFKCTKLNDISLGLILEVRGEGFKLDYWEK